MPLQGTLGDGVAAREQHMKATVIQLLFNDTRGRFFTKVRPPQISFTILLEEGALAELTAHTGSACLPLVLARIPISGLWPYSSLRGAKHPSLGTRV